MKHGLAALRDRMFGLYRRLFIIMPAIMILLAVGPLGGNRAAAAVGYERVGSSPGYVGDVVTADGFSYFMGGYYVWRWDEITTPVKLGRLWGDFIALNRNTRRLFCLAYGPEGEVLAVSEGDTLDKGYFDDSGINGRITMMGDFAYYYKYVYVSSPGHLEVWRSDGTTSRTERLCASNEADSNMGMICYKDKIYFSLYSYPLGNELWVTDGTTTGTHLFVDLMPDTYYYQSSEPKNFFIFNDLLYFTASYAEIEDGNTTYTRRVSRLFRTDGTVEGTKPVSNVIATKAYPVGDRIILQNSAGLWVTDGNGGASTKLSDLYTGPDSEQLQRIWTVSNFGDYAFLLTSDGTLWRTDGTGEGTWLVSPKSGRAIAKFAGKVLHLHSDSGKTVIMLADGVAGGTQPLLELPSPQVQQLFILNNHLYFTDYDSLYRVTGISGTSVADWMYYR